MTPSATTLAASDPVNRHELRPATILDQMLEPDDALLKRIRNWTMLLFLLVAPAMAAVTWRLVSEYFNSGTLTISLVAAVLTDLVLCFTLIVFAAYQATRRSLKATSGSRVQSPLHLRLLRLLSLLALIPAIVTAVVGTAIIVVLGDRIFSEIRGPMERATTAAESYIQNQYDRQNRALKAVNAAIELPMGGGSRPVGGQLRQILQEMHQATAPDIDHLFVVDVSGTVISRGHDSFAFDCDAVAPEAIQFLLGSSADIDDRPQSVGANCQNTLNISEATGFRCYVNLGDDESAAASSCDMSVSGSNSNAIQAVVFRRAGSDKLYSLTRLLGSSDVFLYGQERINGEILGLYIASQISGSDALISRLAGAVLQWLLAYVAALAAMLFLLLRVSVGIARRVSKPVEELAALADRVRENDRDVKIPDFRGEDEIAGLGRSFKDMVLRLVERQDALELQYQETAAEKQKFDSVLTTVSSGVIGLDENGAVAFYNQSAERMLEVDFKAAKEPQSLQQVAGKFSAALGDFLDAYANGKESQKKVTLVRNSDTVELLVRAAKWRGLVDENESAPRANGFVISIEDVTQLTESERAQFAVDAARQVAHDLKSPLQAAKFGMADIDAKLTPESQEAIHQHYVAVESSLERVTDLVNRFKIPGVLGEVNPEPHDLGAAFTSFVNDVRARHPNIRVTLTGGDSGEIFARIDKRNIQDVFENLISNAIDSINEHDRKLHGVNEAQSTVYQGEIRVMLQRDEKNVEITVSDNGTGLPNQRVDLTAANVSTRGPGRGNGLTIVEAAVRKHRGIFKLQEAPAFENDDHKGAMAVILLPVCEARDHAKP